jgi:hypothetical protein
VIAEFSASGTVAVAPGVARRPRTWHIASHLFADSVRGEDLGEVIVVCIEGVVVVELWECEMGWGM